MYLGKGIKWKYQVACFLECDSWYFIFAVCNFEALQNVIHLKSYICNLGRVYSAANFFRGVIIVDVILSRYEIY